MNKMNNDSQLGNVAIRKKLINSKQAGHCMRVCEAASHEGEELSMGEAMLKLGYINEEQLKMLRAELRRQQCRIKGYELVRSIGNGSVGTVYLARQIAMERDVAIKILNPSLASKKDIVQRYISEARAVAKLNHPHIVQGIDVGESEGYYYFTMEHLSGGTMQEKLEKDGPLPEKEALEFMYHCCSALNHAWMKSIIHCDIKPANLMLDSAGRLKITDLGLASIAGE
ncbi:MAG: serine/threonine protein kinase, partial [Planctomycetes bacterium]|nr:serine/threonine protein kinase [Planctomycetota bacterium]